MSTKNDFAMYILCEICYAKLEIITTSLLRRFGTKLQHCLLSEPWSDKDIIVRVEK